MALRADHHTHLFSPKAVQRLRPFGREFPPGTATELVRLMDRDGVDRALVLSVAYFFGMPDLGEPNPEAMAAENDWVADQVAAHRDRLAVCCSVNPLLPEAGAEVGRCAATGRFVGLKLHLANSDVDLRNPLHQESVGEVFECANAAGLMIVVHMRTRRPDYGETDVRCLIDRILPKAPGVCVQIAHGAGWGGYDRATDEALAAFAAWASAHPDDARRVYFDVALEPLDPPWAWPEGAEPADPPSADAWNDRRFHALAERLRAVGLDRVLFATDWPVAEPAAYLAALEERLPFLPAEFGRLQRNTAPWLDP